MKFSQGFNGREQEIVALCSSTFAASEGAEEGELIGKLVNDLLTSTPEQDLFVFCAVTTGEIVGAIVFSRLTYDQDDRSVFVLGPVAVATNEQGKGVGQSLLRHGLQKIGAAGVDVAVTYGDPGYYSKVGFQPISESFAQAPFSLQYPHGWQAQSLNGTDLEPIPGECVCVPAFNDPVYW